MEMQVKSDIRCVNVFKSLQTDMVQKYTNCWIELINQAEQRKQQIMQEKQFTN